MRVTTSTRWRLLLAAAVAAAVVIVSVFILDTTNTFFERAGIPSDAVSWRMKLFLLKATGAFPDLSWSELLSLAGRKSSLWPTVKSGRSLEGSITSPKGSKGDLEDGKVIFRQTCSSCHGPDGEGGTAPSLSKSNLVHGDADFTVYKILRDGIPGTGMMKQDLSIEERWKVVSYLATLRGLRTAAAISGGFRERAIDVGFEDILQARANPSAWLTYSGGLDGWRYSSLAELTPKNVGKLRLLWSRPFASDEGVAEAVPIVVDQTIFLVEPVNNVIAIDASSGRIIWRYVRRLPSKLSVCCGRVNRGLAILGDTLFLGTLDAHLVAINANDGKVKWDIEVAKPEEGFSITAAPLALKDSIVVGVAGGDLGIRGFVAAYNARTGVEKWRFHTIPGPGEFGHDTWHGDSWKHGGGPTWITGSFDPVLNILYWGVGNPFPDYSGDMRAGDNLFTNSAIALDADTGRRIWHFQFTPHDERDWDSTQTPILADIKIKGAVRKVVCWANRNGFYYVLDRKSGEFLHGSAFVEQNWAEGLDRNGRPIPFQHASVSTVGRVTHPGVDGGVNWQQSAFDPAMGWYFVHATEGASTFAKSQPDRFRRGEGGVMHGSGTYDPTPAAKVVRALDASNGSKQWEYFSPDSDDSDEGKSGLLVSAGGLLFGASAGMVFGLDKTTGAEVWRVRLGGISKTAPVSFQLNGRQVLGISVGRAFFLFGL